MGKGYVTRNGKVYARKVYVDSKGKKKQIWRLVEGKAEVKKKIREIENDLDLGTESFENRDTLDGYLDKWLETIKGTVADRTWEDYQSLCRLYVRPVLGKRKLSAIKPMDIQVLVSDMKQRGLSPRTVQYTHTVLRRAFKEAVNPFQLLVHNPAREIKLPKRRRNEMKSLSPETADKFLKACSTDEYGLLFEFALISGMRPGEILALRWCDVDLPGNKVSIQRALVRNRAGGGWSFQPPKTAKSRRTIPIPVYLKSRLAEAKMAQNAAREAERKRAEEKGRAPRWEDHDLVFCSEIGTPLSLKNLQDRHFKPILKRAGLEGLTTYQLRHSCATLLLVAGVNPKVVAERLGHASVALTLDCYSHVLPTMQEAATDELERILKK